AEARPAPGAARCASAPRRRPDGRGRRRRGPRRPKARRRDRNNAARSPHAREKLRRWRATAAGGRARKERDGRYRALFGRGGAVGGRQLRPLAEEELVGLVEKKLLPARRREVEAILVDDHLRVLEPHLPGIHGDRLVDALTELVVEGLIVH